MTLRLALTMLLTLWVQGLMAAETPTLELIMSDPDWIGNAPEGGYWSDDGEWVYFQQKRHEEIFRDLYRVPAGGGQAVLVPAAESGQDSNATKVYNRDRSQVAWVHGGDILVKDLASGDIRQLTKTSEPESDPMFMADGDSVSFVRGGANYVYALGSGTTSQPADIRFEKAPDEPEEFDPLREQQMRTFETLREDKRQADALQEHREALQKDDPRQTPLPIYLGDEYSETGRALSPSGRYLMLAVQSAKVEPGQSGKMPNYVSESGYTDIRDVRTRVGRKVPPPQDLILVDLESGEFNKLSLDEVPGIDDDPLASLRKSAVDWHVERGANREQVEKSLKAPEQRPVNVRAITWNAQGDQVAIRLHAVDNKDRWLMTVDFENNALQTQHRLTDEAWINWDHNEFGWMPDGRTLWYLSEESGYSQLYVKDIGKRRAVQLTSGSFVVREPAPSPSGEAFYVVANRTHPGNYEVYRVPVAGGELEQITSLGGVVRFTQSPGGDRLLLTRSHFVRHNDLYVQATTAQAQPLQVTDTVSERFKAIDWVVPEIIEVPSSNVPRPVYSKLYLPPDFDQEQDYPAVMFVHGAGYTQNAHMGWPYYFRELMFHTLLANEGYVVIDMDYRASKGYGRNWRTAIYRNMGHPELEDFQDGVSWLAETYSVDPDRVGVYGGSYGGFMTFMALFRAPGLFAAGAGLRPVVDWMNYNQPYTSNILNTPDIDPVAYQRSSPINFVEGLDDPLLIAVGMQDDNVFFQDSVLLVQRLLELQKEDWNLAVYPLDAHGFVHPDSWLDEYRRIYKLMNENLK